MYNKILVPLALDHGLSHLLLDIARGLLSAKGEILALHVVEEAYGLARATQSDAQARLAFERSQTLMKDKMSGELGIHGHVVEGHVYRSIIEFAAQHEINCIVMGSHKPGLSDYLLGSTAARVVRHAPCAVHVHR
ncbi:universal stress protein [Shimia abyssi]|uniref:Nucleotide-binding universal stress UspA family protein n=1 Tax=Shimia abyssi TaxID=1662395 RepID=A0A2P8FHA9_9RHOB|nr:universal stress protein [Shimia abyssi]PSL21114.1 nucleotide-binding universal stress UspA family protein [Shimia abyssi]